MTKVTISVSKVYKNSGNRFHRAKTPKHWRHYFVEDGKFGTEWVNPIQAIILKFRKHHQCHYICIDCKRIFIALVKRKTEQVECPYCE